MTSNHRKSFAQPAKTISAKCHFFHPNLKGDLCEAFEKDVSQTAVKLRKLTLLYSAANVQKTGTFYYVNEIKT